MLCPRCRTEYGQDVTRCPACDIVLVEDPPPAGRDEPEWVDLVTVLETGDPSLLLVAKSLLDVEKVPSFVEGEGDRKGLGAGRSPSPTSRWDREAARPSGGRAGRPRVARQPAAAEGIGGARGRGPRHAAASAPGRHRGADRVGGQPPT